MGDQNKQQRWHQSAKGKLARHRQKDRDKGLRHDLDLDWWERHIIGKRCTYCGTKDQIAADRIDNNLGHTKSNCIPACHTCNMVRGNRFTVEEMKLIGPVIRQIMDNRATQPDTQAPMGHI